MIFFDIKSILFWKVKKEKQKNNFCEIKVDEEGTPLLSLTQKQKLNERKMLINYPVGSSVICKSNEDEPYEKGVLLYYLPLTQAKRLTPVVKLEDEEEPKIGMGIVRHYSEELCCALDKLSNIEQWNVLSEFHKISK